MAAHGVRYLALFAAALNKAVRDVVLVEPALFAEDLLKAEKVVARYAALVLVAVHFQSAARANVVRHVFADVLKARRVHLAHPLRHALDVALDVPYRARRGIEPQNDVVLHRISQRRRRLADKNRGDKIPDLLRDKKENRRSDRAFEHYRNRKRAAAEGETHHNARHGKDRRAADLSQARKQACHQTAECERAAEKALLKIRETEHRARCDSADRAAVNSSVARAEQDGDDGDYPAERNALNRETAEREDEHAARHDETGGLLTRAGGDGTPVADQPDGHRHKVRRRSREKRFEQTARKFRKSAAAAEQKRDSRCKNRDERREGCEQAAFCDFSEVAEQPAHAADRDHHRDVAEAVRRAEDYITQRRAEERRNQTFLRNSRRE